MNVHHNAVRFLCGPAWLYGVISLPEQPQARGLLIVTGGPQYRAGSHRQFTLLAQALAETGVPVMRFDYRGMGDSEGAPRDYTAVTEDLASAIQQFFDAVPALRELVMWGLCDGATAAACHAHRDARVRGLVLCNPWVRSDAGAARATLRHYYGQRLRDRSFWTKLASGGVHPLASLTSLGRTVLASASPGSPVRSVAASAGPAPSGRTSLAASTPPTANRPDLCLLNALQRFPGHTLIILSGDDLTAREFSDLPRSSPAWRQLGRNPRLRQLDVAGANHTFARADWRRQVEQATAAWLASW